MASSTNGVTCTNSRYVHCHCASTSPSPHSDIPVTKTPSKEVRSHSDSNQLIEENSIIKTSTRLQLLMRFADHADFAHTSTLIDRQVAPIPSAPSSLDSDSNKTTEHSAVIQISARLHYLTRFADTIEDSTMLAASSQKSEESLIPKTQVTRSLIRNVYVLQRECAFTQTCKLITPPFASCYILTGYDPTTNYKFLAHIDDGTAIESIHSIFKVLKKSGIKKDVLSLSLAGGWKILDSAVWGESIVKILKEENLWFKTNVSLFQKKSPRSCNERFNSSLHGYLGAVVETNGNFRLIQEEETEEDGFQNVIERMQCPSETISLLKMYEAK